MHDQYIFDIYATAEGEYSLRKVRSPFFVKRSWTKLISHDTELPLPKLVEYSCHIPGKIIFNSVLDLKPKDIVIEGYEADSFKGKKGVEIFPWIYRITGFDNNGVFFSFDKNWSVLKNQMKEQGMHKELLAGKKTLAAMVRVAHAIRLGIILTAV